MHSRHGQPQHENYFLTLKIFIRKMHACKIFLLYEKYKHLLKEKQNMKLATISGIIFKAKERLAYLCIVEV